MSKKPVYYDLQMLEDARRRKWHLFTIQITGPAGEQRETYQGYCNKRFAVMVEKFMKRMRKAHKFG